MHFNHDSSIFSYLKQIQDFIIHEELSWAKRIWIENISVLFIRNRTFMSTERLYPKSRRLISVTRTEWDNNYESSDHRSSHSIKKKRSETSWILPSNIRSDFLGPYKAIADDSCSNFLTVGINTIQSDGTTNFSATCKLKLKL